MEISQNFGAFSEYMNFTYFDDFPHYINRFLSLATYAEEHIEDEDAPVFLRFINLLINDAIYLLDEALGYMKQIQVSNFLYISAIFGHCTVLLGI